jgi:hypothetical protein
MNKIIAILLAFLLSVSTCQKKVDNEIIEHTMIAVEDTLTKVQLDSVIMVDELSFNIEEDWIASPVLSEDRSELLYKYVFIKEMTDSTGTVYTLCSYQDTLYILNKRVVE